jgi:hypothetical protein
MGERIARKRQGKTGIEGVRVLNEPGKARFPELKSGHLSKCWHIKIQALVEPAETGGAVLRRCLGQGCACTGKSGGLTKVG